MCPFPTPSHPQKGKTGKGYNETLVSLVTFVNVQRKMPEITKCTVEGGGQACQEDKREVENVLRSAYEIKKKNSSCSYVG